jgi:hypothetical protein
MPASPIHFHACTRLAYAPMSDALPLAEALSITRTGDIWLFRGSSAADRAIRIVTNSPVNHVGMAIAIDDLPPLLWHAELGASLQNVWTGERHRGAQLHRLDDAVRTWRDRYGQQAWFRQIDACITDEMETSALRTINEFSGRAFPRSLTLGRRWLMGRIRQGTSLEHVYCAELVAITYERMGLLGSRRPPNWYDPGRFWSGDRLQLVGASLGPEIHIDH